jgi:hypothetical protein
MQPGSLLSRLSGSAELTDTYRRGGIPASLASQRNIPQQRLAGGAPPPYQQRPRDIGNPPTTRAGGSQVRVTLSLGFGDRAGAPVQIDFHRGGSLHRDARGQGQRRSKKKKLPEPDGIGGFRSVGQPDWGQGDRLILAATSWGSADDDEEIVTRARGPPAQDRSLGLPTDKAGGS